MFIPSAAPEGLAGIKIKPKKKTARNLETDRQILPFIRVRNNFLDALLRREGRGPWWTKGCMGEGCLELQAEYRCQDCFASRLLCGKCLINRHRDEPLHIIEKWEDGFFQPCSLQTIDPGLRFQLGHPPGEDCDFRHGPQQMVVLENNAIHKITVDFCGCIDAPSVVDQLFNVGWFPATVKEPETCATLNLLRHFHTLNLQGRVPAYDFYKSLEVLSDRAGMRNVPDRLEQFTLITREYRHLQMCKRGGRGHDGLGIPRLGSLDTTDLLYGIDATQPGELAIPCRACPNPGINLPEGWEKAPPEKAWLYQLLLSQDANFKMKGRNTSTRERDPMLGPGFAYVVAHESYMEHLSKCTHEEDEISHCSDFEALWRANTKRGKGLRATGIESVSCSRHELFHANGTGDLQRGERFANMDYLFLSSLVRLMLLSVIASYDIACQWFRNFWERHKAMPTRLRLPANLKVQFKVPKFHLAAHIKKCHAPFSFNYTKWVGRTDGEGVERNWSWLNMIARSVSVMGPGSREDTIDDFCGYANWRKTVGLGNSLLRKMALHIPKAILHNRAFHAFTEGLREGHEEELMQWEREVRAWELDSSKKCPYDYPEDDVVTMEEVWLRIAREEHERVGEGASNTRPVCDLARLNADIEWFPRARRKRTILLGMVKCLRDEQGHFMPGLASLLAGRSESEESNVRPEELKLYLPSSFTKDERDAICVEGLPAEEERVREAQAHDALQVLRRQLRTRIFAFQFKRKHVTGQAAYTKSQALQSSIETRIKGAAGCYNRARDALLELRGPGEWESVLKRTLNEEEKEEERRARVLAGLEPDQVTVDEFGDPVESTVLFNLETGEGNRLLSWIWYTGASRDVAADGKLHNDIRIEWVKARSRADRWREDIIYLEEEMHRVLEFCTWKAAWWDERRESRQGVSPELAEGLRAYATEQAARERYWRLKWERQWEAVRRKAALALANDLNDVTDEVAVEVEVEEEVAYGEYGEEAGEPDEDLLD
ncbi:hypothetical protein GGX14DRAFT_537939 [Mycena pura]|uniref:CxC2-like cysteine cluster KDZ transposase-associated domain-containing protein n=1 Tax=Mycena pura TaxID=153505 RepID=A0AAD6Y0E6_9AGAR|nr:hypothetical protein GGX14DRAFT_537939 [Mycena pura]